jgi:hypothetical protein
MLQVGRVLAFLTAFPVDRRLIHSGMNEEMERAVARMSRHLAGSRYAGRDVG